MLFFLLRVNVNSSYLPDIIYLAISHLTINYPIIRKIKIYDFTKLNVPYITSSNNDSLNSFTDKHINFSKCVNA